ncbi:MAG TPA: SLOG family protein [Candidatus Avimonas sp.]|nr:DUF1273 domain-containing protein [Clostridiales bacterium]HPU58624.1 SLOG family protein [Candidatus Avimonas sp.]
MEKDGLEREITCCISGHRPEKLPFGWRDEAAYSKLKNAIRLEIIKAAESGYRNFISGMALGVDTWAAEEVVNLREQGFDVRLIAALPCPEQDSRWPKDARERFKNLLAKADGVYVISDRYTPFCMGARNLWMVEHSSLLIAVFNGRQSGTYNTIFHAECFGLNIVVINPDNIV